MAKTTVSIGAWTVDAADIAGMSYGADGDDCWVDVLYKGGRQQRISVADEAEGQAAVAAWSGV